MDEQGTTAPPSAGTAEPAAREDASTLSPQMKRRNILTLIAWIGFLAACTLFPGSPANGIIFCPFRLFTGLSCPGCGMTRSCTSAVRFELWESLSFHPIGIPLILGFSVLALWRLAELVRGEAMVLPPRVLKLRELAYLALFLFVLLFGGARLVLEISGILTQW